MKVLEVIGTVIAYIVFGALGLAMFAVDIWILLNYGLFVWLISVPIAMTLLGLLFALASIIISGIGYAVYWAGSGLVHLFGFGKTAEVEAESTTAR